MPLVIRAPELSAVPMGGSDRTMILDPAKTGGGRLAIELCRIAAGHDLALDVPASGVAWLQVLEGAGSLAGENLTPDIMSMLPPGFADRFRASADTRLVLAWIPDARPFDPDLEEKSLPFRSFDWTKEPVLQSEHDGRKRIYLATEQLFGTTAFKGEMIIYPPNATAPDHHHEGAEHYQYILAGSGTAILEGEEVTLNAGDLLYNLEYEVHSFANRTDEDFVFVEYFVPGVCKTVWAPKVKICAWMPTGQDLHGREPSRYIGYHSHGDGTVV